MGKISNFDHDKSYFVTPAAQIACVKNKLSSLFSNYPPKILSITIIHKIEKKVNITTYCLVILTFDKLLLIYVP